MNAVHPIEAESYRRLAERADLSHLGPGARAVVARVVHASADLDYVHSMVVDEATVEAAVAALRAGTPVVTDVEMTRAGITGAAAHCHLGEVTADEAAALGLTRSAAAVRIAARRHPGGALLVVGCAPTALAEAVRLHRAGEWSPTVVVGLPVGFVGAAESKADLRASGLPAISNIGEKGGSAVAAAALNALVRLAQA